MADKIFTNLEIAGLLRNIAASYQLKDETKNKFRIVAYERAADAIEHESSELKDLWDEGKLSEVPGVGKSIAEDLDDLFKSGKSRHFESILKGLPQSVFKLMDLPGIGVKTANKLVQSLKISEKDPISDLKKAAEDGRIATLPGFGEESQKDILGSIGKVRKKVKRHILPYALQVADEVIAWLKKDPGLLKVEVLGSLRRKASTVGDIDIGIASKSPSKSLKYFTNFPHKQKIIELGNVSAAIITTGGVQVDVIALPADSFGSLLQHFTGSKLHNIALREYALKKGLSLSERGIKLMKSKMTRRVGPHGFQGSDPQKATSTILKFDTEEKFYQYLGLQWIPPELREDRGEIASAQLNKLPKLVQLNEVRGDLQIHSNFDIETSHDLGSSSMIDIVKKSSNLGYEYIAFTEHNPSHSKHSESEIIRILRKKKEAVNKVNSILPRGSVKRVFNSLEVDILPSGDLPISEEALETLDFALISIHSSFDMPKAEMTQRILKGLSHSKVKIWAHPTGRLLQKREGIEADYRKIFEFCVKNNKFVEVNADPMRLDLPDFLIKDARELGVKFTFGTDAHNADGMNNMPWAISVARRGWLEGKNILNCLSLSEIKKMLE